jgi:hypothetical protein
MARDSSKTKARAACEASLTQQAPTHCCIAKDSGYPSSEPSTKSWLMYGRVPGHLLRRFACLRAGKISPGGREWGIMMVKVRRFAELVAVYRGRRWDKGQQRTQTHALGYRESGQGGTNCRARALIESSVDVGSRPRGATSVCTGHDEPEISRKMMASNHPDGQGHWLAATNYDPLPDATEGPRAGKQSFVKKLWAWRMEGQENKYCLCSADQT